MQRVIWCHTFASAAVGADAFGALAFVVCMLGAVGQGSKVEAKVICGGLSTETLDNAIDSRGVEMG
jgi:hypothetical protein